MATLNRYRRCTRANLAFISETRCNTKKAEKRIKDLPLCNSIIVPSQGNSSGLWMLWGDDLQVGCLRKNKSIIAVQVVQKIVGLKWMVIGVYRDPHRSGNQSIWEEIDGIMEGFEGPICVLGDFNSIVTIQEKAGGSSQLSSHNTAFRQWIHSAGLVHLGYHGPAYTWTNKQQGKANISERLD